ncbi:MAG: DUF3820 family protein [Spirochaetia bacterium]|jgi:uncharacterized protein (DUF3820 family)|nr:DUF3820 family protein [Spirochaetia bacterium]
MSLDIPDMDSQPNLYLDPESLLRLANAKMPFGKYAGRLLIDLPESYVVWFSHKGYPRGDIGEQLQALYTIKENGLEPLVRPLVGMRK